MESEIELTTFEVNLKCPDCEIIMIRDVNTCGEVNNEYLYSCLYCAFMIKSSIKYPYLKYVPKQQ